MAIRLIRKLVLAASSLLMLPVAEAGPILQEVAPTATTFTYLTDFQEMTGTGFGDVTAQLFAVDLVIPPGPVPSSDTSGCEAADFAGFPAGSIALIQRGTCTFAQKVINAEAAGAVGVLIFNEGQIGRTDVIVGTLLPSTANIVVFGTSFAVGDKLYNGVLNGPTGVTAHMKLAPVPEPAALGLVALGLAGLGFSRRNQRREPVIDPAPHCPFRRLLFAAPRPT